MVYELDGVRPDVDDSAWIAPGAIVIGDVKLAANSSVWFGAVLRGDSAHISIGERSNIQDNCTVHADEGFPTTVHEDVTIGHNVVLHGCTIGAGSLIGINATVLNGATIGRNCLIASNALVREGQQVPDNSVVMGSPGKVVKDLDDDAIARIRLGTAHYVHNAKRFRDGLKEIDSE